MSDFVIVYMLKNSNFYECFFVNKKSDIDYFFKYICPTCKKIKCFISPTAINFKERSKI